MRLSRPRAADLYAFAWRNVRKLPEGPVRGIAHAVADVTWLTRSAGVHQLERNLGRLRPDLSPRELRRASRTAMRSYMRYFVEAFQLPGLTQEQIDARVRTVGLEGVLKERERGRSVSMALGHAGNWDLAGAWACRAILPVLTIAEKLPDGLYEEFFAFRTGLGMNILPLERSGTFRSLLREARKAPYVVTLLADRDLTRHGIEVDIAGHRARVAAGPAALALAAKIELYTVAITYERLHGERRRRAGGPWGIVIEFRHVPSTAPDGSRRSVEELTQGWIDELFDVLCRNPQDWHMLQKVFLADLDPDRLARQKEHGGAEDTEAGEPRSGTGATPSSGGGG